MVTMALFSWFRQQGDTTGESWLDSTIETTISPETWASSLAKQKRYRDLAMIFCSHSYHAQTDTAERKRELAASILVNSGSAAVDALVDTLIDSGRAIPEIAELLVKIDDPKAAQLLRQLFETEQFERKPSGIEEYIHRHLG